MTDALDRHGNRTPRWHRTAPKPRRFEEMAAAYAAGDSNLFAALVAEYKREECGE